MRVVLQIRGMRVRKIFGDSKKLDKPKPSLPTLLFDDEGVSRGARAPAACSVVLPTIVIARSLRLESGGR